MFSPDTYNGFGESDSGSLESDRYSAHVNDKIEVRKPITYDLIEYSQEETVQLDENSFLNPSTTYNDFTKSLVAEYEV